mmetsp:Transcript_17478/g.38097  ORF Transcript_17478/g.38097 Transcript_17478/m.38097 type:complete len:214 (-) Transcript_17478:532-1173(-)
MLLAIVVVVGGVGWRRRQRRASVVRVIVRVIVPFVEVRVCIVRHRRGLDTATVAAHRIPRGRQREGILVARTRNSRTGSNRGTLETDDGAIVIVKVVRSHRGRVAVGDIVWDGGGGGGRIDGDEDIVEPADDAVVVGIVDTALGGSGVAVGVMMVGVASFGVEEITVVFLAILLVFEEGRELSLILEGGHGHHLSVVAGHVHVGVVVHGVLAT